MSTLVFNRWFCKGSARSGAALCILLGILVTSVLGQATNPHHGFLGGPWEVVVKMGHEGQTLRLAIKVTDENKPQDLEGAVPVVGTPIKVRLDEYIPDLAWETVPVADPNGGAVAKLSFRGENLNQDLWLSAAEVSRQAISSHIGGVAIRELPAGGGGVLQQLVDPEVAGVLLVTLPGSEQPIACPAKAGTSIALPGTTWEISVLRYVPHYSINRETKEVISASDKPVNPAVEIEIEGQGKEYRQWLWSKFPSSPHKRLSLPFPVRFLDFHLEPDAGQYILVVAEGMPPKLLSWQDGKRHIEPVEMGQRFPFKDSRYTFAVDEVRFGASIEKRWKNDSDVLLHPAVIATISGTEAPQQVVLELNKPYHHKTVAGTLVVLYRRVP